MFVCAKLARVGLNVSMLKRPRDVLECHHTAIWYSRKGVHFKCKKNGKKMQVTVHSLSYL